MRNGRSANEKLEGPTMPNGAEDGHLDTDEKVARNPGNVPIYNELELASETDLSVSAIMKGTATKPMTNFEKKAAMINAEIDKFGMGRYQICIWLLCGFGYFLDLAWSQGVGLIATAIYQEMDVPSNHEGNIWACANAGLAIGALFWGLTVDIIGRRWAFNLTCLITSIFGLLLAAPMYNYGAICGIYFLASLGLGGNIPIDATIALEFLPQSRRNLVSLLSIWQPIGVVAASGIAYGTAAKYRADPTLPSCKTVAAGVPCCGVKNNMGWRYEVIVLGGMTLVIFFLRYFVFHFHESPKFLISRGRDQEAIDVLHAIAKFNKQAPPTLTAQDLTSVDIEAGAAVSHGDHTKNVIKNFFASFKHLKGLFGSKLQTFIFVLLAFTYMVSQAFPHSLTPPITPLACDTNSSPLPGRLLVLQPRRLLPPHRPPQLPRLHRHRHRLRHLQTIRLHLPARHPRRRHRPVFRLSPPRRPKMVPRLQCNLPGSRHGDVYSSQDDGRVCGAECVRVPYADVLQCRVVCECAGVVFDDV